MNISDFDYDLPDGRIARFPLAERDASKLLVWRQERRQRDSSGVIPNRSVAKREESPQISETVFGDIGSVLPEGSLLVFNNTRVVRARLAMFKPSGARIEILCLEPTAPADYERAFAARGVCEWKCMVGNSKKWKSGPIEIPFIYNDEERVLRAWRADEGGAKQRVRFTWDADLSFGELLELLGRVPIPPYLNRDSEELDNTRYQTVFARVEGSVAAPTAGLHFTPELLDRLRRQGGSIFRQSGADVAPTAGSGGEDSTESTDSPTKQGGATDAPLSRKIEIEEVTLHVGAGTFLPVKTENALEHTMHTEHFEVTLTAIEHLLAKLGRIVAVGTTSVRTLESLSALAWRVAQSGGPSAGDPEPDRPVGQFEPYDIPAEFDGAQALEVLAGWMRAQGLARLHASTQIMIHPGYTFRIVGGIITNFHQPKSTLLLLIAAFTGGDEWRRIYNYALTHDFRFLSYGDSSLLTRI